MSKKVDSTLLPLRVDKWQLSPASQLKQLTSYTLADGRVQVFIKEWCTLIFCSYSGRQCLPNATDCFLTGWREDAQLGHSQVTHKVHTYPVGQVFVFKMWSPHLYSLCIVCAGGKWFQICIVMSGICYCWVIPPYIGIMCIQFDDTRIVSGSSDKTIKVLWHASCVFKTTTFYSGMEHSYQYTMGCTDTCWTFRTCPLPPSLW